MDHQSRLNLLRTQEETNKNIGLRYCDGLIRADGETGDDDSRRFTLSFSSEEPYMRWFGLEILSHSEDAINLERLNTIGVLLFNHDVDRVCGKILKAWLEDGRCYADVEFDRDDDSFNIYQKVKNGTLKATSVRYSVEEWEEVEEGETSEDGKEGPCWIARKWTPLEVSIVSVPADATVGVGRDIGPEAQKTDESKTETANEAKRSRSLNELQLIVNKLS